MTSEPSFWTSHKPASGPKFPFRYYSDPVVTRHPEAIPCPRAMLSVPIVGDSLLDPVVVAKELELVPAGGGREFAGSFVPLSVSANGGMVFRATFNQAPGPEPGDAGVFAYLPGQGIQTLGLEGQAVIGLAGTLFGDTSLGVGVQDRVIAQQTGHRSMKVLGRYIRDGKLFEENAAAEVGL